MNELSRRRFLHRSLATTAGAYLTTPRARADDAPGLARPREKQVVWQDCEVGVIFHFDMPLVAEGTWRQNAAIRRTWNPLRYDPRQLDTDQWLEAAHALGARYAVLTATHFNGFLQWQSDIYPYGVRQARWREGKGDLVRQFVDSCHRYRIQPGLYLSCFRNAFWRVDRYRVEYGQGGPKQTAFARMCEGMVRELCCRYGPLLQIWFDAGLIAPNDGGPDVLPIVDQCQPNMVFYHSPERREHRWIGNESGVAGYPCWATMPDLPAAEAAHKGRPPNWRQLLAHGDPDGKLWSPAMADTVLRNHHWFWKPDTERTIEPLPRLIELYYTSVGRNANLMLGLTPNPDGLLPDPDCRRCAEFGREIRRRFGTPVAQTSGTGTHIELPLPSPARIDHVVMMEEIRHGERVRQYVVEGLVPGGQWRELCRGISIGHKRIQRFGQQPVTRLRLRITQSAATPRLRRLAAYHVG